MTAPAAPPPAGRPSSPLSELGRRFVRATTPVARLVFRTQSAVVRRRRVPTPTILQMEAVECGAAALAIVLATFGRWVQLEELRAACGVSRDGSKASNVLRAARQYGLDAKGYKREPADLRSMPLPMIVHWNFNHFLVVEGFGGDRVFLNDPASGPRQVSSEEFDQSFTGVALVFTRAAAFARGGHQPSVTRSLRRRLPGTGSGLALVILAGLLLVVPGVVTAAFSRVFIDNVIVKGTYSWLAPLLIFMTVTALLVGALGFLQQRYLLRLENSLSIGTASNFFWHVLRLPVEFFTQRFAGEIGNRVALNDKIARLLSGDLASNAINVLVVAFYAVLLLQYDVTLALVGVTMAGLNIAALRYVSQRRRDLNLRLLQDRGKLMGTAMGGLQTIETIKASGSESDFFAQWAGYQAKVANANQQLSLTTLQLSAVPPFLAAVNTAVILGLGGLRVMNGALSMGMLTAFQALMLAFTAPIGRMIDLGSVLQEVQGDMNRLDDVLNAPIDATLRDEEAPAADRSVKLAGTLELRDVSFGYSRLDPPLIEHFSLTVPPGSRVALVGSSGCGKSTIARLVAGLYEPWSGSVCFDGVPRADVPRSVLTSSFAAVDQDVCLFEDTVRANLSLWDATIPEHDLIEAARDACLHEEIAARPGGYGSIVAEAGRNYSGGQRQRMEIARALAPNPSILLLDEATSALDPSTEKLIDDNLRRRGCTCLLIAHRLSAIRDCNEIIVLDHGKVVQRGTHEELAAVAGRYRDLIGAD